MLLHVTDELHIVVVRKKYIDLQFCLITIYFEEICNNNIQKETLKLVYCLRAMFSGPLELLKPIYDYNQ